MHILVTGGTGFIGRALVPELLRAGHRVTVLTRSLPEPPPATFAMVTDLADLDGDVDGVINLAGASLADHRWTSRYKQEIVDSRLATTRKLGAFFKALARPPKLWVNASAIGYYGNRADEALDERSQPGTGFAAELCRAWEAAAREAAGPDTRVCVARFGVVLDREGGAYPEMARPFRFGVANWIGNGHQWLSWIHRQDVVRALMLLVERNDLEGVFNVTAPEAVTSRGFCEAMQQVHRTFLRVPMPAFAMRVLVGEMADELLIGGQHVVPAALLEANFCFDFPTLSSALQDIELQSFAADT